jgi:hypothetical protein
MGTALVGFGVRRYTRTESISERCFAEAKMSRSSRCAGFIERNFAEHEPIDNPLCVQPSAMKVTSGSSRMLSRGKLFTMLIGVSC